MARVIKGGGQSHRVPTRAISPGVARASDRRVIDKEVYRAKQKAKQIIEEAREKAAAIEAEGKKAAAQAREEAQADGAKEAFAEAAMEALLSFRSRAARYAEAAEDIRALALEVVRKVMGNKFRLSDEVVDGAVEQGLKALRARRTLRVQIPHERVVALQGERPILLARLRDEPDLLIEAIDDVNPGFARIVTEVGGALCSEQTALDALAEALEVHEQAVAPTPTRQTHQLTIESHIPATASSSLDSDEEYDEGEIELSDEDDSTQVLADFDAIRAAHHARGGKTRRPPSDEATEKRHSTAVRAGSVGASRRSIRPLPEADADATMALDVSDFRKNLEPADSVEDLHLYADDSALEE